jgi:hypothetical protein
MNRAEILDAVKKTICEDRQDVHGNPEDTFQTIARLWSAYLDTCRTTGGAFYTLSSYDVATMMALFKIARFSHNPSHADNLHDLIGYAAIAAELTSC